MTSWALTSYLHVFAAHSRNLSRNLLNRSIKMYEVDQRISSINDPLCQPTPEFKRIYDVSYWCINLNTHKHLPIFIVQLLCKIYMSIYYLCILKQHFYNILIDNTPLLITAEVDWRVRHGISARLRRSSGRGQARWTVPIELGSLMATRSPLPMISTSAFADMRHRTVWWRMMVIVICL